MDIHPGEMMGPLALLFVPPDIHIIYMYIGGMYISHILYHAALKATLAELYTITYIRYTYHNIVQNM